MLPSRSPGDDVDADTDAGPDLRTADPDLPRPAVAGPGDGDAEVMAAVDADADGGRTEFVIADVSREEAWLAADRADAPVLREWR